MKNRGDRFYLLMLMILSLAVVLSSSASSAPLTLSDQGTDAREASTGNKIFLGNLTVEIWDAANAGNKIWNDTFANSIKNGSWNLMLGEKTQMDLEYGQRYWKDYYVNGQDINFTNSTGSAVARLDFYAPIGIIESEDVNFTNLNVSGNFSVVGNLNVTGTSYLGSVTLTADNITVSKIIPELGDNNNLTIYNATGSAIAKFRGDGKLEVWNPAGGAGDYAGIYHDGSNAIINAQSGVLALQTAETTRFIMDGGNSNMRSGASNTYDLGTSAVEWRGFYVSEDALSGAYFGLDQDWRLHYDEANLDRLFLNGTNAFEIVNKTSGQTIFFVNATDRRVGIGTTNPTHTLHVAGDLNVSGVAYLGNSKLTVGNITTAQLEVTSDIKLRNNTELIFGSENYTALDWSTAQATAPTLTWGFATNAGGGAGSGGNSLIITTETNKDKNFQHPSQTNPTIFIQSAETPDSSTTKWGMVTHDNTTMLIDSGDNTITLNDNTTIKGDLVVGEEGLGATLVDMYDNSTEFVIEAVHNVTFRTAKMVSADSVFRLVPIAGGTHPVTCDASSRGGLFVNNTGKDLCICGDSGWMFVSNRSGC